MPICNPKFVGIAAVLFCTLAQAHGHTPKQTSDNHLSGAISDYTPATFNGKVVGPWAILGIWSMNLHGDSGLADFYATLSMEKSDYAIVEGIVAVDDPATRSPHAHSITMTDATVSYDTSSCPANSPANTLLFMISGPVTITGNGGAVLSGSSLSVCVSGGANTSYSNVTLVFTGPATGHFGSQPINGVID